MSLKMTQDTGTLGEDLLVFTKKRGAITIREIYKFLEGVNSWQYGGHYYLPFAVKEDSCQGWELGETKLLDPDGNEASDKVVLTRMTEGEPCHFCGEAFPGSYCPHCGESIKREDYAYLK